MFRVRPEASKDAIRDVVERMFKVSVLKVRTLRVLGKKRRRGRIVGARSDWKKAYVTLKEGDKIEFFEGSRTSRFWRPGNLAIGESGGQCGR